MRGLTVVTTLFIAILILLLVLIVGKLRVLVLPIMPRVPETKCNCAYIFVSNTSFAVRFRNSPWQAKETSDDVSWVHCCRLQFNKNVTSVTSSAEITFKDAQLKNMTSPPDDAI